ncbi:MAG: hypothetical protein ACRC5A_02155 [Enterobacteriaceae bacterium]
MPVPKVDAEAQLITVGPDKGKVLVFGGSINNQTTLLYDPGNNSWQQLTPGLFGIHAGVQSTLLQNGYILYAGGFSAPGEETRLTEFYNPYSRNWIYNRGRPMLFATKAFAHLELPDGSVLFAGGERTLNNKAVIVPDASVFMLTEDDTTH